MDAATASLSSSVAAAEFASAGIVSCKSNARTAGGGPSCDVRSDQALLALQRLAGRRRFEQVGQTDRRNQPCYLQPVDEEMEP